MQNVNQSHPIPSQKDLHWQIFPANPTKQKQWNSSGLAGFTQFPFPEQKLLSEQTPKITINIIS